MFTDFLGGSNALSQPGLS